MIARQDIDRRTFMKLGGTALVAGVVPALEAERKVAEAGRGM